MKKTILSVSLLLAALAMPGYSAERVKFVLFTDLHHGVIPEREQALRDILEAARKNKSEFVINLGDLTTPLPQNQEIADILDSAGKPVYHVLGNHDMDRFNKRTFMDFVGMKMKEPHYYFDRGNFRFVVMDTNFFLDKEGKEHAYAKGNYAGAPVREHVSAEQVEWLKGVLADQSKVVVIFSHAPLNDQYDRVVQYAPVHKVITQARDNGTRIAAVIGGHNHSDSHHVIDGINYLQMNSVSYIWGGDEFTRWDQYPDSVYRKYTILQWCIPYEVPLYAVFTINENGKLIIEGVEGSYVPPAPDPQKLATKPYRCSPSIESRKLKF